MSSDGTTNEISEASAMAEEHYVKAKTCVWWDIENCAVPRSCDPYSIAQNIRKALAEWNYKGMVTISAYGDTKLINSSVQQALSSTGIGLNHVPAGIKDASDKKILVDMLIWGYDNPPPATHLLISGDRDFSNALHQLRMKGYNILLAQPEKASQALVSAAKTVWLWTSLVVGGRPLENISELHNTLTSRKPNSQTQSIGDSDKHNKGKQISKSQNQPTTNTLSSKGNLFGELSSFGPILIDYLEKNNDKFADGFLPSMISNLLASMPGSFDAVLNNALKPEQQQIKAKDEQLNGRYVGEGSKPQKRKSFRDKCYVAKKREHKIKALKIKKNKASANASTLSAKEKGQHKIKAQKNKASANASTLSAKEKGLHKIKAQKSKKNKKNKASTSSSTPSAAVYDQILSTTRFCFNCGKVGHIRKQCLDTQESVPVQAHDVLPKDEIMEVDDQQIPSTTKLCFKCGKAGHIRKQCPDTRESVPMQAHGVLPKDEIGEGNHHNNTSKTEALANAPVLSTPSTSQGVLHTFEAREKVGQFNNRCIEKQESAPDQAYGILSSSENMEGNHNNTSKTEALANAPVLSTSSTSQGVLHTLEACEKVGQFNNRCIEKQESAPGQAYGILSSSENMEENHNNTPKSEALTNAPALHTPPTSRRIPNTFDGKCFGCGKVGHFHNQCPGNRELAYNVLSRDENMAENHNNTSKSEALTNAPALHTPPTFWRNPNTFDGRCFGCGKVGHFHNQCPGNREQASIQAYNILSRDVNMEVGTYNDTANAHVLPAPLTNYGFPYTFEGQMLQRWNNGEFSEPTWREPRIDSYPSFYRSFY